MAQGHTGQGAERRTHHCVGSPSAPGCPARPIWAVLVRRFEHDGRPFIEALPVCAAHLRPTRSWPGGAAQHVEIVPLSTMRGGSRQSMPPAWLRLQMRWR